VPDQPFEVFGLGDAFGGRGRGLTDHDAGRTVTGLVEALAVLLHNAGRTIGLRVTFNGSRRLCGASWLAATFNGLDWRVWLSEMGNCDRTVIRQAQNPEEHRRLRTYTE
jgi:hypothetical protein